jgi:CheY-like chemotaxis protein
MFLFLWQGKTASPFFSFRCDCVKWDIPFCLSRAFPGEMQRGIGKRGYAMARILVVEDDEPLRSLYKYELEEEGHEVIIAEDGKTALKSLEQSSCDLILLDMVMPEMDGLETLAKIASRQKRIPVVIHTAYVQSKGETLSALADACLTKSSDLSILKSTIKRLLETYRDRKN